jgi:hypothetical protein
MREIETAGDVVADADLVAWRGTTVEHDAASVPHLVEAVANFARERMMAAVAGGMDPP